MNTNNEEHYVVVTQYDGNVRDMPQQLLDGPIVAETYLGKPSTLEEAKHRAARMAGVYGQARIAKLVFIEDEKNG